MFRRGEGGRDGLQPPLLQLQPTHGGSVIPTSAVLDAAGACDASPLGADGRGVPPAYSTTDRIRISRRTFNFRAKVGIGQQLPAGNETTGGVIGNPIDDELYENPATRAL
jgi:hypothetical protein